MDIKVCIFVTTIRQALLVLITWFLSAATRKLRSQMCRSLLLSTCILILIPLTQCERNELYCHNIDIHFVRNMTSEHLGYYKWIKPNGKCSCCFHLLLIDYFTLTFRSRSGGHREDANQPICILQRSRIDLSNPSSLRLSVDRLEAEVLVPRTGQDWGKRIPLFEDMVARSESGTKPRRGRFELPPTVADNIRANQPRWKGFHQNQVK